MKYNKIQSYCFAQFSSLRQFNQSYDNSYWKSMGGSKSEYASNNNFNLKGARGAAASKGIQAGAQAVAGIAGAYKDLAQFDRGIADNAQALSLANLKQDWNNTSTTGLMNQWNSTIFADNVTRRQMLGSKGSAALKSMGHALNGAASGAQSGSWIGAIIGAAVGGAAAGFGRMRAKRQATKLAQQTNALNAAAKQQTKANMVNNATGIQTGMIKQARRNMAAYGGNLFNVGGLASPTLYAYAQDTLGIKRDKLNIDKAKIPGLTGTAQDPYNMVLNTYDLGGQLNANGATYTTGLNHVDEGGTHEENPYDGVPMGADREGTPNFVEEGESIYNNYVFSDRLKVPKIPKSHLKDPKRMTYEEKVLKPYQGMTFSDAAKKAEKDVYGEGGNLNGKQKIQYTNEKDKKDTLDSILAVLAETQEQLKQEEEIKQLQEAIANMSPEEIQALQQQMMAKQQQEAQQQQMAEQQAMQQQQQITPEEQAMMQQQQMQQQPSPEEVAAMQQQEAAQQPQMSPEEIAALEAQQEQGYAYGGNLKKGNYFDKGGKYITINGNKYEITADGDLKGIRHGTPDWDALQTLMYGNDRSINNPDNDNHDGFTQLYNLKNFWSGFGNLQTDVLKYLYTLPQEEIDNLLTYGYPLNSIYGRSNKLDKEDRLDIQKLIKSQPTIDKEQYKKALTRAKKRLTTYYKKKGIDPNNLKGYAKQQYEMDIISLMNNSELIEKDTENRLNINKYSTNGKVTYKDFNTKANVDGVTKKYGDLGATEYLVSQDNGLNIPSINTPLSQYLEGQNIAGGVTYNPNTKSFVSNDKTLSYDDLKGIENLVQFDVNPFSNQEELTDYYKNKLLQRYKELNITGDPNFDWDSEGVLERTKPYYLNAVQLKDFINNLNTSSDLRDKALASMLQSSSVDGKESPLYMEMLGQSLGLNRAANESDESYFQRIRTADKERFNPPVPRNSDALWGQDHPPFLRNNGKIYRMRLPNGDNSFEDIWLPNNLEGVDYSKAVKSEDGVQFTGKNFGDIDIYDLGPQNLGMKVERVGDAVNGYRYFSITDDRAKTLNRLDSTKIKDLPTWNAPKGYTGSIEFYEDTQKDPNLAQVDVDVDQKNKNDAFPMPNQLGSTLTGLASAILGFGAHPDYSRANAMLARGYFTPRIAPMMVDRPLPPQYLSKVNAENNARQAGATAFANIRNTVSPTGKGAALIAAANKNQVGIGNQNEQINDINNKLYTQYYSQDLDAMSRNQQAQLTADQANLQAFRAGDNMIAAGLGLAENIDKAVAAARSAGMQNLANTIYRNERNKYAAQQAGWYIPRSGIPFGNA